MKWCCYAFEGNFGNGNQRGVVVKVIKENDGEVSFIHHFRSVEKGKEKNVKSEVPISYTIEPRILFCPWCGRNLAKHYKKQIEELLEKC